MSSVSTIFEKSIAEIEDGRWICGELCQTGYDENTGKSTRKMMACAVGMVSLYGGHTKTSTITINDKLVDVKYAMYPEDESVKKAPPRIRTTLEYLVQAIPNKEFEPVEDWDYDEHGEYVLMNTYTKKNLKSWPMTFLSGTVVSYNDGAIADKRNSSKSAAAWFKRAYKMYQKDQTKAALAKLVVAEAKMIQESKTLVFA